MFAHTTVLDHPPVPTRDRQSCLFIEFGNVTPHPTELIFLVSVLSGDSVVDVPKQTEGVGFTTSK